MSFRFIRDHAGRWPVRLMCRVLYVSASGYYAWRSRPESARARANRTLLADVRRLHREHHGRYGSPRMHAALRAEGRMASRGRVARLMRRHGIRALAGRRFKPCTTDSRHYLPMMIPRFRGHGFRPFVVRPVPGSCIRVRNGSAVDYGSPRYKRTGHVWPLRGSTIAVGGRARPSGCGRSFP